MPLSLFVPGRLCLFGEHSDWAGQRRRHDATIAPGVCLLAPTDQGIRAWAEPADDFELTSRLPDGSQRGPFRVPMEDAALSAAASGGEFFAYAAGTAAEVLRRNDCGGVRIRVEHMDLPIARGLSSSAAICVLTARALSRAHDLGLDVDEEMELAYRGELAAGSQCGRMDQACAYGRPVLMGFDADELAIEPLAPARPLYLLIVDLLRGKDTRAILADLNHAFGTGDPRLREALGATNRDIVSAARLALEAGDAIGLGALMICAQEIFDAVVAPASAHELAAPRLHEVLRFASRSGLSLGGKGVGSQGDGCAQLVCAGSSEREQLAARIESAGLGRCLPLTLAAADGEGARGTE